MTRDIIDADNGIIEAEEDTGEVYTPHASIYKELGSAGTYQRDINKRMMQFCIWTPAWMRREMKKYNLNASEICRRAIWGCIQRERQARAREERGEYEYQE